MINKLILFLILFMNMNGEVIRNDNDQIVFDTTSKLMWQDDNDAIFNKYTWEGAITYCENLDFSGHNDWRLPNINELYTLVDLTKSTLVINSKFINTKNDKYWTSSTGLYQSGATLYLNNAWYIDFTNGSSAYQLKTINTTLTRCVRDIN